MAQTEDTELRDLVIEALEKNGSLAKIRALLRANIFLAFEEEGENIKQNINLDNVLKLPEGRLCLSLVHEFLDFCNLKNTLFVYVSESRQGKDYSYDGQKLLADKLNLSKRDVKEPLLLTMIKNMLKPFQRKYYEQGDVADVRKLDRNSDDQNCTYIVHEDSSSVTSNSQSDNSSDEKNKLHLRLQLDNSDTDTSSDSARDKTSSEYIPNEHNISKDNINSSTQSPKQFEEKLNNDQQYNKENLTPYYLQDMKTTNTSSDSTSYIEIKTIKNSSTPHVTEVDSNINTTKYNLNTPVLKLITDTKTLMSPASLSNVSLNTLKSDTDTIKSPKAALLSNSPKSDNESDYSNDFTSSLASKKNSAEVPASANKDFDSPTKNSPIESPRQHSQSSQSSVSISDVADLLSEKSLSFGIQRNDSGSKSNKRLGVGLTKSQNDDSGEFSESPIPSLSNLSLDIHSD